MGERLGVLRMYIRADEQVGVRPAHTVVLQALRARRLYQVSVYRNRFPARLRTVSETSARAPAVCGYVVEVAGPETVLRAFLHEESQTVDALVGPVLLLSGETLACSSLHAGLRTTSLALWGRRQR